jgi:hypothetical protein
MCDGGAEDIAWMGHRFVDGAVGDLFLADEAEAGVDEKDADGFMREVAHVRADELVDEFGGAEGLFDEGFAFSAAADLEGGGVEGGFGGAEGFFVAQKLGGEACELGEAAVGFEKTLGDLDGVFTGDASVDEEGEEFGVGEGCGAEAEEALARAVVPGEVRDAIG